MPSRCGDWAFNLNRSCSGSCRHVKGENVPGSPSPPMRTSVGPIPPNRDCRTPDLRCSLVQVCGERIRAMSGRRAEPAYAERSPDPGGSGDAPPLMVGRSVAYLALVDRLQHAARVRRPVLLLGERGTGKELCARWLHQATRTGKPFVALNCGTLSRELHLDQLFGHRRGAFSGATRWGPLEWRWAEGCACSFSAPCPHRPRSRCCARSRRGA